MIRDMQIYFGGFFAGMTLGLYVCAVIKEWQYNGRPK